MNQEVKELWLKALESGEYVQHTGAMACSGSGKDGMNHCCLGVLSVLYAEQNGLSYEYVDGGEEILFYDVEDEYGDCLNSAGSYVAAPVAKWAGLDASIQPSLAVANDNNNAYPIDLIGSL